MTRKQYPEDSLVVRVGMRIRKLRLEQHISIRDFGKKAGLNPFHVMAIELGQLAANTRTLRLIASALGVSSLDILNCDAENDDLGYLIELMRTKPKAVQALKEYAESRVIN